MANFGLEEGDVCCRDGCTGVIAIKPVENCSCHINAPCSNCIDSGLHCPICGWVSVNEGEHLNDLIFNQSSRQWEKRPLDPRKIDYHNKQHTSFSMIREGVYPEGTTKQEVEAVVKGTFGGRFNYFAKGKFQYVVYTD